MSDYKVSIGTGWCVVLAVGHRELICAPSDEIIDQQRSKVMNKQLAVVVHAASIRLNAGVLVYVRDGEEDEQDNDHGHSGNPIALGLVQTQYNWDLTSTIVAACVLGTTCFIIIAAIAGTVYNE